MLTFVNCSLNDDDIKEMSLENHVTTLMLMQNREITNHSLEYLKNIPELSCLELVETAVSMDGIKKLCSTPSSVELSSLSGSIYDLDMSILSNRQYFPSLSNVDSTFSEENKASLIANGFSHEGDTWYEKVFPDTIDGEMDGMSCELYKKNISRYFILEFKLRKEPDIAW